MKTVSDELFQLIKSLTKQEKRYFKLYASRHVIGEKNQYVRLFDAIDRLKVYDEKKVKKKFAGEAITKQLHVAKNYLYKLILNSLRLYKENKTEDPFPLLLRNAQILFKKGLIKQSEKILDKAMKSAVENEHFLQILEVYRWKHHIIHNSNDLKRLEEYVNVDFQKEIEIIDIYRNYLQFQLLHDKIFIPYWRKGSIRNKEESASLSQYFEDELYRDVSNARSFNARMFYHNARFSYHYQRGELKHCYAEMKTQTEMFEQLPAPQRKGEKQANYISSMINLYIVQKEMHQYQEGLETLLKLRQLPTSSQEQRVRLFTRSYNLEIDLYLSTGQFQQGINNLHSFERELDNYRPYILKQHRLGLYYNLAYLYFGAASYDRALDWINQLLNDPDLKTREDIQAFSRILNLLIHYELGHDLLLESIVLSNYRFLSKRRRLYKVESVIFRFLKKYTDWISPQEIMQGFLELKQELVLLVNDEYEKQAFDYFNFIAWLDSKIEGKDFGAVVRAASRLDEG